MSSHCSGAGTLRVLCLLTIAAAVGCGGPEVKVEAPAPAPLAAAQERTGTMEPVARFFGNMPTGVAVSEEGRIFVNFPRWEDALFTVAEVQPDGSLLPYPSLALNQPDKDAPELSLWSVQSIVVDARNRLWLLDTGRIRWEQAPPNAPKLVAVDLFKDQVVRTIVIAPDVAGPDSYLNDVRFDLSRGKDGVAYITDSSEGGIIAVDLATGTGIRRLAGHPSTQPAPVQLVVEGRPLYERPSAEAMPKLPQIAADGIAISPTGDLLYYCPLSSRRLYAVPTLALRDPSLPEDQVVEQVRDLGPKPAVDGMIMDEEGRLYLTAFEHNAIMRRLPDGRIETVLQDGRLLWPDTLAIGRDGFLYVTANQLHRQPQFNGGVDLRRRPFALFRTPIGAGPVLLR